MIGREMDPCVLFMTQANQVTLSVVSSWATPKELQLLLDEFGDIFQVITGIPPPKLQDHKIPLKDEGVVVRVKPYRYPMI